MDKRNKQPYKGLTCPRCRSRIIIKTWANHMKEHCDYCGAIVEIYLRDNLPDKIFFNSASQAAIQAGRAGKESYPVQFFKNGDPLATTDSPQKERHATLNNDHHP
jgi:hypothetical protein